MKINRKPVRVGLACLGSLTTAGAGAYALLSMTVGPVDLPLLAGTLSGAALLVGSALLTVHALAAREDRKRQAQARREENAVLYWSGPFQQPEYDRVELTAWEDYVIMEWDNAEREQIARMLGDI